MPCVFKINLHSFHVTPTMLANGGDRRTLQLPAPVITSTNICVLAYMLSPIFAYFPHSCQPCDLLVAMPYLHMHNVNTDKKSRAGKSEIRKIPDIRRIRTTLFQIKS